MRVGADWVSVSSAPQPSNSEVRQRRGKAGAGRVSGPRALVGMVRIALSSMFGIQE